METPNAAMISLWSLEKGGDHGLGVEVRVVPCGLPSDVDGGETATHD